MAEDSDSQKSPNGAVTWEGCSVLLDINDGDRLVFARLSPAATVKIGNQNLSLKPLVGCPFGSLFQVVTGPKGSQLARVPPPPPSASSAITESTDDMESKVSKHDSKDNRLLVDNNSAQRLSSEDIDTLRREGASGDVIIEALIANSSTFEKKTVFSQEKYKLRKQKKYAPKVLLRRPSARSIGEAYFKKYPMRIGFMRVDALSLLLSMSNVHAYSDVLVVDKVGGLVTGAIAERLGSAGHVCNTYFGDRSYPLDIVKMFNFSADTWSRIIQAPFSILANVHECDVHDNHKKPVSISGSEDLENADKPPFSSKCMLSDSKNQENADDVPVSDHCISTDLDCCGAPTEHTVMEEKIQVHPEGIASSASDLCTEVGEENSMLVQTTRKAVPPGKQASLEAIKMWKERGFTSLVVAAPELDTETIVPQLLSLLSPSAPFAIYHQYLQPLANCMHRMQVMKSALSLQISESWLREYQVLQSRTHPHMQMSAFGGYILCGINIPNGNSVM